MKKKSTYTIAVAGATGAVGKEIVELLEERNFPLKELVLLESELEEGERIEFRGGNVKIGKLEAGAFQGVDIAFLSAGPELSRAYAPEAVRSGAVVIDTSDAFRRDSSVPLVVPEINPEALAKHTGIIANPSSATIGMAMALMPIHQNAEIKRIVVTMFESVSGTGKKAIDELASQTVSLLNFRDVTYKVYPHQIAFNCLPHVGIFADDGRTDDESKLESETQWILGSPSIRVSATLVRVPVFRCHAGAVNIETTRKVSANEVRALLSEAPGIIVYDDPKKDLYPVAIDVAGKDDVYVGRIREDASITNGIGLWFVSDNLRKGAALNAVQIAEQLVS